MTEEQFLEMIAKLEEINQDLIKLDADFVLYKDEKTGQDVLINEKLVSFEENNVLQQEAEVIMQEKIDNLQYQVDQVITFQSYNFIFFGVIVAILIVMLLFRGFKIRGK